MAKTLRSGKTRVQDSSTNLLDSVQEEVQRLQRENEELLMSLEQDRRISLRGHSEAEQLLEEQRQMHEDLQSELLESQDRSCALEERCNQLEDQLTRVLEEAELEQLRAVDKLRRKYDNHKERLLQQLQELQERFLKLQSHTCVVLITPPGRGDSGAAKAITNPISGGVDAPSTTEVSNVGTPVQAFSANGNPVVSSTPTAQKSTQPKGNVVDAPSDLSTALLAQQLPPLPHFHGGDSSSEKSFQEWIGQFELVAEICRWSKQAKLTTRLRGEAFSFFRSCSKHQKSHYDLLVAELKHRFTPVRIQSVETSLFYERKQGEK